MSKHLKPQLVSRQRKSGIEVMGEMSWGSHFCVFYETKQDLLDVVIPYFKAGLESNEFVLWVISNPDLPTAEEAIAALEPAVPDVRAFLEKGQLEIFHESDWYRNENEFNLQHLLKAWKEKIAMALARGYDGIRAAGDLFWLGQKDWNDFYAYEKHLHTLIEGEPAIVLCAYPISNFGGAEILDVVQAHQFAIGRRQGKWELIENPLLLQAEGELKKIAEILKVQKEPATRPRIIKYLLAAVSVGVATVIAFKFVNAPVSLFLCAIMFSAWYGGTGPGLFALALATWFFAWFWADAGRTWIQNVREMSRFLIFIFSSVFVVLVVAAQTNAARSLRRAYGLLTITVRKLREANGELRLEVKERIREIVQRKQAEDKLQLAYQRLRYHLENTPLAVVEFNKDLTITRWSGRAEEIFGWKASEALHKNVFDPSFPIIYEEDVKAVEKINDELRRGIANVSLNRNYTNRGEVIYCEWYNSVLRDDHGNVITVLSLVHDVTKRRKAEETLSRSYEEIRQLTNHLQNIREEERSNIAREIHDELGQQLTVLKMDVLGLGKRLNGADVVAQEKIGAIIGLLDTTVKSVRRISSELRPSLLYDLGLVAAIEWQLKEFGRRSGIKTVFIEPVEELKIADPVKNGLFRIFQESLTNAGRYANATQIIVSLEHHDGQLILTIEDDGQGFEKEKIGSKQTLGILGMRERCQMMGGVFQLKTAPGKGTTVIAAIPYNENE